mmetsp:Transcript_573/g.965  ORF Transcript_573/g.965 Transcript_573/m.965 type:complete len:219 (-) Transcript_573:478-1134(-)
MFLPAEDDAPKSEPNPWPFEDHLQVSPRRAQLNQDELLVTLSHCPTVGAAPGDQLRGLQPVEDDSSNPLMLPLQLQARSQIEGFDALLNEDALRAHRSCLWTKLAEEPDFPAHPWTAAAESPGSLRVLPLPPAASLPAEAELLNPSPAPLPSPSLHCMSPACQDGQRGEIHRLHAEMMRMPSSTADEPQSLRSQVHHWHPEKQLHAGQPVHCWTSHGA